jgi:perosamine synthetase
MTERIPLSSPDISDLEIEAVVGVLRTARLSLGPKLVEFERAMAAYVNAGHAVAISSGTAGLDLGLLALHIGPGDEVILPAFTFVAAANAIRHAGATPVFVDIEYATRNLSPAAVERAITPRTRAIMAVHTFGVPADMDALGDIAQRHDLHVMEDACEALGAEYKNRKVGALGAFGVFSFYPNKPITTGEGGVLVTNDAALAATVKALRNQGRTETDTWLQPSIPGYNYRLPEMSCALGIAQLSRLDEILERREAIARRYCEVLRELCPQVRTPLPVVANGRISWFAFVIEVPDRDRTQRELAARGIGCRAYFPALCPLPVTNALAARTLALPFFNRITEPQIQEVCETLAGLIA